MVKDASSLRRVIEKVNLVIPALEDVTALRALQECAAGEASTSGLRGIKL